MTKRRKHENEDTTSHVENGGGAYIAGDVHQDGSQASNEPSRCGCGFRFRDDPWGRGYDGGFRCIRTSPS